MSKQTANSNKQLPIEIKRNYGITNNKDHWILKCDVCGTKFQLKKPEKGKDIHGGNILSLLDHAASHPVPQEEEMVVSPPTPPPPSPPRPRLATIRPIASAPVNHKVTTIPAPPEKQVEMVAGPTSQVSTHKSGERTVKYPNAYKVDWFGTPAMCHMVKVSGFKDPTFTMFRHVQKVNDHHYSVVVEAANGKHGELIGKRLIQKFFREQVS